MTYYGKYMLEIDNYASDNAYLSRLGDLEPLPDGAYQGQYLEGYSDQYYEQQQYDYNQSYYDNGNDYYQSNDNGQYYNNVEDYVSDYYSHENL